MVPASLLPVSSELLAVVGDADLPAAVGYPPPLQHLVDRGYRLTMSSNTSDGGSIYICHPSPCGCDQVSATAYVLLGNSGPVGLACLCCHGRYSVFVAAAWHWRA